jgi:hypothetical protein
MIKTRRSFFPVVLVFLLLFAWVGVAHGSAQQAGELAVKEKSQEEQEPEKIVGVPKDAKQKTGIWVFLIWVWISVFVLVYFLRLKIKEADRLYRLRFYSAKKN